VSALPSPTLTRLVGSATGNGAARSGVEHPFTPGTRSQPHDRGRETAAAPATAVSLRLRVSERELWDAYSGGSAAPGPLVEPCACGTPVVCVSDDIPSGVRAHQELPEHRSWRERAEAEAPSFHVPVRGEPPMP